MRRISHEHIKMSSLFPILAFEGELSLGLDIKSFRLYLLCNELDNCNVWAIIDCREHTDLLCQYLCGTTSLYKLYHTCDLYKGVELFENIGTIINKNDGDISALISPLESSVLTVSKNPDLADKLMNFIN